MELTGKQKYRRAYYLAHREHEKACQKSHYWSDPVNVKNAARKSRLDHPENTKETKRKCRLKYRDKNNEYNGIYYRDNKNKIIKRAVINCRLRNFGVTPEMFNEMLINQENSCGICGRKFVALKGRAPNVDHIHDETNKIRGLLCGRCNSAIGLFKDEPISIINAIAWLENPGWTHSQPFLPPKKSFPDNIPGKREKIRNLEGQLKVKYGLSLKDKELMLLKQDNKCGICQEIFIDKRPLTPCVDHAHDETKKIRGLLCENCNWALGLFDDNPSSMKNAIKWIINKGVWHENC